MIDERWDPEVEEIAEALAKMLAAESSPEAVRAAERDHQGVSPPLQLQIDAFGLDGLEGSPALFARIAMEFGRSLASVPFVETMPVLALTGQPGIAFGFRGLVPASLARAVVWGSNGATIVEVGGAGRKTAAGDHLVEIDANAAGESLGDADLADRLKRYAALVNAARIVGAGQALLSYARDYVCEREQFGRPIGSFQAIGHRLANVVGELDAADLLVRKAAFAAEVENGGDGAPPAHFATMVWAKAVQAGRLAATDAHQVFGGNGFAMEYDVQLYSRRIRNWIMRGPRTSESLADFGRALLDPASRDAMTLLWQFETGVEIPRWAREADRHASG